MHYSFYTSHKRIFVKKQKKLVQSFFLRKMYILIGGAGVFSCFSKPIVKKEIPSFCFSRNMFSLNHSKKKKITDASNIVNFLLKLIFS